MQKILAALACNLDKDILQASFPLFAEEKIEAIEWSFDTLYNVRNIPEWFVELLREYGRAKRLIGHGVYFSLFSGKWAIEQQQWLQRLERMSAEFHFDHVTEHFGFMTGEDFHKGAPISIPFTPASLAIGQDRLKRICHACQCPVGLENLALAYSLDEVKKHGEFLEQLVEPVNGFIILDLHNLYCQIHNFDIPFDDIIQLYPLERVREIHISGGSWEDSPILPHKKIRRDTHDGAVPEPVFSLLEKAIPICPNLKYTVLEQMGTSLNTDASRQLFRLDFEKMATIIGRENEKILAREINGFLPPYFAELADPLEDMALYSQQIQLSNILEQAKTLDHARHLLSSSSLAHSDWHIEQWAPYMLETVLRIAQKWKDGFG
jgi:uncharacterized protein (UPF0276 family)